MNVVHIVGGDLTRGAHRGAYWLHLGLRDIGVHSTVLGPLLADQEAFPGVVSTSSGWLGRVQDGVIRRADRVLSAAYSRRQKRVFTTGLFGRRIMNWSVVRNADVVNVHWASRGPLSIRSFGQLAHLGKATVWTLRDMWPFTGGCHYTMDCDRYMDGCGCCPQLGSKHSLDLSRIIYRHKERHIPKQVKVVGISEWLSNCARQSRLFRSFDVRTIPNCIDTDIFKPVDKEEARSVLGISSSKKIVLVGAENLHTFYKGFASFVEATKYLTGQNVMAVLFGNSENSGGLGIPIETRNLGYLRGERQLRLAYSAADVFVAPSRQEAFGKTLVEAMACGTPVVCFDATGPKDIVAHKVTGYKATPFDAEDLARGIRWVLEAPNSSDLGLASIRRAASEFGKQAIARRYLELYQEMLG